jgi:pimeloyl-ACP methyl ester carboxylesterase
MRTINFQTTLGAIPVTGLSESFDRSRPAVLAITGVFAAADEMSNLPRYIGANSDAFVCHLPGNHTPPLSDMSIEAFSQAFDETISQLGRPVVVFGISIGGVVGLGMRQPRAVLAVDPPLSIDRLWPMDAITRADLPGAGVTASTYHHLLDHSTVPVHVVLADEPLEPERPVQRFPSLVSAEDRMILAKHHRITVHIAPSCGHDIPHQAPKFLHERLLALCELTLPGIERQRV